MPPFHRDRTRRNMAAGTTRLLGRCRCDSDHPQCRACEPNHTLGHPNVATGRRNPARSKKDFCVRRADAESFADKASTATVQKLSPKVSHLSKRALRFVVALSRRLGLSSLHPAPMGWAFRERQERGAGCDGRLQCFELVDS